MPDKILVSFFLLKNGTDYPFIKSFVLITKGFQMSYGFAPGIEPNQIPNPNVPRGSHESVGSTGSYPNIGWALSRGDSITTGISELAIVSQEEIPCQSIFVPEDEMPFYGNYGAVSKSFSVEYFFYCLLLERVASLVLHITNFLCLKSLKYVHSCERNAKNTFMSE